ncbi:hypothetical protein [Streptomyces diastatochromogenes]|uniref:hypothetical protein n=1 Tax=Streptomyces diastatochromogenes TaxID=42236 RepID=UPI0036B6372F
MGATEDDLTELTEGESGNPISGMFRDALKIAKAIAGGGDRKVSRLPVTKP